MAVTMVSASMPFSLASASIVCISGFCIIVVPTTATSTGHRDTEAQRNTFSNLRVSVSLWLVSSKFHFQPAARDQLHRQPVRSPLGTFQQHGGLSRAVVVHAAQPAFKRLLVVHRFAQDDLREA